MAYKIVYSKKASKQIKTLPKETKKHLERVLLVLAQNPLPPIAKKLINFDLYTIRLGKYRLIYQIHGDLLVVFIVRIEKRPDSYKGLSVLEVEFLPRVSSPYDDLEN